MANDRLEIIRDYIKAHPQSSSTEIFEGTGRMAAYATVRRDLARLVADGDLLVTGAAIRYRPPMSC